MVDDFHVDHGKVLFLREVFSIVFVVYLHLLDVAVVLISSPFQEYFVLCISESFEPLEGSAPGAFPPPLCL